MVANHCQSKKIKISKIKKHEIKNENKKIEKIKKILFRKKPHQMIMTYECQIWYLVTRLYRRNKDFFGSPLKNFPLEITILRVVELLEEIKKNIRIWGLETSRFRVMALWREGHEFIFSTGQIFSQKLLYHTVAMISLKRFHIVTHVSFHCLVFYKNSFR